MSRLEIGISTPEPRRTQARLQFVRSSARETEVMEGVMGGLAGVALAGGEAVPAIVLGAATLMFELGRRQNKRYSERLERILHDPTFAPEDHKTLQELRSEAAIAATNSRVQRNERRLNRSLVQNRKRNKN